ncbi:scyllo-inositol 2-dehydrogenase (NADP+) [Spiroplasma chinense]|uniref:Scyllo-inositol 2-dehydrogenase (NADP+) n=1 Tax=Spiroplasma chinense TaxID=216932 RepID=A0A5B9Y461_9MOLU|nr:Gfo/Idh/MocA family oxidoreductase [Spiroplasma chinense]QEH61821.1 scyllo-inositol 2-dehydrogenase (NADP+) [Spiroplasma chinense]
MIKIGTIGTSKITEDFINSASKNPNLKVVCCYSRDKQKARELINKNKLYAIAVDSFEKLVDEIDAVYIASPNGLHYEQAKYFLQQQKHVLLEKPLTLEYQQACELFEIAAINNVILMEAYKTAHLPQFSNLFKAVNLLNPFMASFNMNQYSSRMVNIKQGIYDSVFDGKLGKGSTYDMLIYPVELAIALFGPIKEVKSMGMKLPNGSGLNDIVLLKHENEILVNITCSKTSVGRIKSEILADHATIVFDNCINLKEIKVIKNKEDEESISYIQNEEQDLFEYEISVFVKMILTNDYKLRDYLLDISCEAVKVLNLVEKNQKEIGEI